MKDFLQVFFAVHLHPDEISLIKPREREISEYKFVALSQLKDYTDHPRMKAVEALLEAGSPVAYLEDERVAGAVGLTTT